MKTRTIIASIVSLIAITSAQTSSVEAQQVQTQQALFQQTQSEEVLTELIATQQVQHNQISDSQSPYLSDSISHPLTQLNQQGTGDLQEKVLMQINEGLFNGSLSASNASQFKNQLNKLNDQESWYKSLNSPIPATLAQKNTVLLNEMMQRLQPKPVESAKTENALHSDIDELVSKALARNHISSGEAEKYYLRLAQIESNIESTKKDPADLGNVSAATHRDLSQLKSELLHKVN
jgi:hypothetical protein